MNIRHIARAAALCAGIATLPVGVALAGDPAAVPAHPGPPRIAAGPAGGLVPPHEDLRAARTAGTGGVKLLSYHNGPVMAAGASMKVIYWGARWGVTSFVGDKKTGLDALYGGFNGSAYMSSTVEYTQSGGSAVSAASTYTGSLTDVSATPTGAPSTSAVLSVVARNLQTAAIVPPSDGSGYYPVYSDQPRGTAGYCAWHSYGTINGTPVQFAFFFNLDGDAGCNPSSTLSGSQGLKALANVSGHELSEAVTDPRLNAWYDSSGAENSDKCAWSFGSSVWLGDRYWKIQGNWSNKAYNANLGYTRGCVMTG